MAFALVKINQGRINQPEPEYLPVSVAVNKGDALVFGTSTTEGSVNVGTLIQASATTKPLFIAMADGASGDVIPVCRVTPEMLWETAFSAAATSIKIGYKVTIAVASNHAAGVTATTTSGVATVAEMFGTAIGDTVYVRFE